MRVPGAKQKLLANLKPTSVSRMGSAVCGSEWEGRTHLRRDLGHFLGFLDPAPATVPSPPPAASSCRIPARCRRVQVDSDTVSLEAAPDIPAWGPALQTAVAGPGASRGLLTSHRSKGPAVSSLGCVSCSARRAQGSRCLTLSSL